MRRAQRLLSAEVLRGLAIGTLLASLLVAMLAPALAAADDVVPLYSSIQEMEGMRFAYVNGSVYDKYVNEKISGTSTDFYPSLADCVAAIETGKADAAVQRSYCCQLAVNQHYGTVALLPETLNDMEEEYFFPLGDPRVAEFNEVIARFWEDGTIEELTEKWASADNSAKTLPEQDWDAPNGTLKLATTGSLEPFSYVGPTGDTIGFDIDLALLMCKELGYHLKVQTLGMDAIIPSVQSGKSDFGGTLTYTDERAQMVDFTDSVMPVSVSVIVKAKPGSHVDNGGGMLSRVKTSFYKTFIQESRWKLIAHGLGVTIFISLCSGVLGTLLAVLVVHRRRNGASWIVRLLEAYQALMGGVPLVVVLMLLYYVVFGSFDIPGEVVSIIAFTLAFGATAATTMWTAISGIDPIQEESGLVLGYTREQTYEKVIFPQAMQQFLPQLLTQFVSLVKDTSIVGYIAVHDLTRASDLIRSRTMDAFFPIVATAIIYFILCRLLARVLDRLTGRLRIENRPRTIEGVEL